MSYDPSAPLVLFEQVSKWYGPVLALNQVTLTLTGGITGLVGSNGAGKSTLIKLATGQVAPSLGRVTIRGIPANNWQAMRLIGYCPDHDAFYEDLSGRKFVYEMAKLFGYTTTEAKRRTEAAIAQVNMAAWADRIVRGYSKGMRQRVKLAQALLHDPELLILDEPLSGIDPLGRVEMLQLFRDLAQQGKCLLLSSHELEELEKLTNHVAILAKGRIAAVGTLLQIRELLDDRPRRFRIELATPDLRTLAQQLLAIEDVLAVEQDSNAILVKVKATKHFYDRFQTLVCEQQFEITRLEPLDESTHAILGYLLGGSGKT